LAGVSERSVGHPAGVRAATLHVGRACAAPTPAPAAPPGPVRRPRLGGGFRDGLLGGLGGHLASAGSHHQETGANSRNLRVKQRDAAQRSARSSPIKTELLKTRFRRKTDVFTSAVTSFLYDGGSFVVFSDCFLS